MRVRGTGGRRQEEEAKAEAACRRARVRCGYRGGGVCYARVCGTGGRMRTRWGAAGVRVRDAEAEV